MSLAAVINGQIVTPDGILYGSVIYEKNGKIVETTTAKELPEEIECIDAKGGYVIPGGIDPHVHFGGFGSISIADDFYNGSMAALAGGTTTVIDFCEPEAGESVAHCVEKRMEEAKVSVVDYKFHFVLTKDYKEQLKSYSYLREKGIKDFKLFTTYDNTNLTMDELKEVFEEVQKLDDDITFLIHAEDDQLIHTLQNAADHQTDMSWLAKTRPVESESECVRQISELAKAMSDKICIAHISAGTTLSEINEQIKRETCPHYLAFSDEKLEQEDACLYTMTPPLRNKKEQELLWEGLLSGSITMLATDHCPYRKKDKEGKTYQTVPCGVDGVQTRLLYLYTEGVKKRGLSMKRFVELTSENAARFYHLYPQKGAILPGSDADLVILQNTKPYAYKQEMSAGKTDYTIYEGMLFEAKIAAVIKSGRQW